MPLIDEITRKTLLQWLSKGLSQTNKTAKTEEGIEFEVKQENPNEECIVHCVDGDFMMPAFQIVFKGELYD